MAGGADGKGLRWEPGAHAGGGEVAVAALTVPGPGGAGREMTPGFCQRDWVGSAVFFLS